MAKKPSIRGKGADIFFGNKKSPKQAADSPVKQHTVKMVKTTFYLTDEANLILEKVKLKLLEDGNKINKSSLVSKAIRLLGNKFGIS